MNSRRLIKEQHKIVYFYTTNKLFKLKWRQCCHNAIIIKYLRINLTKEGQDN